jgi:hypothetical protein
MSNVDDEWMAIAPCRSDGSAAVRWFVLYCEAGGGESIVGDCATEDEAMTDASFWHLPIVPWRPPSIH